MSSDETQISNEADSSDVDPYSRKDIAKEQADANQEQQQQEQGQQQNPKLNEFYVNLTHDLMTGSYEAHVDQTSNASYNSLRMSPTSEYQLTEVMRPSDYESAASLYSHAALSKSAPEFVIDYTVPVFGAVQKTTSLCDSLQFKASVVVDKNKENEEEEEEEDVENNEESHCLAKSLQDLAEAMEDAHEACNQSDEEANRGKRGDGENEAPEAFNLMQEVSNHHLVSS